MNKIHRYSNYFQYLLIPVFFAIPLLFITKHLATHSVMFNTINGPLTIPLSNHGKTILTILDFFPLLAQMFIALCFYQLLGSFKKGHLFITNNTRFIRRIGLCLLAILASQPITEFLMSLLLTDSSSKFHPLFSISTGQIALAATGIVTILMAWVMKEATNMREDGEDII